MVVERVSDPNIWFGRPMNATADGSSIVMVDWSSMMANPLMGLSAFGCVISTGTVLLKFTPYSVLIQFAVSDCFFWVCCPV